MGFIRDRHGRIAIESRRESFYVHANYGYSIGKHPVESLEFETDFLAPSEAGPDDVRVWRIVGKYRSHVEARESQFSTLRQFLNGTLVEVPGTEDFNEDEPLARLWHDHPHPEFANEDLDDLIAALVSYRKDMQS